MAKILEEIKAPISREMKLFEEKFYQSMQSSVPLLDKITQFIIATKGKQMRPILVFLSAKMIGEGKNLSWSFFDRADTYGSFGA